MGQDTYAESECWTPMKASSNSFLFCVFSSKVCHNVQHKSLSSSPSGLFLPAQAHWHLLLSSHSAAQFSCLGKYHTTEAVIITGYCSLKKKHLWHLTYFCLLSIFQSLDLKEKFIFLNRGCMAVGKSREQASCWQHVLF